MVYFEGFTADFSLLWPFGPRVLVEFPVQYRQTDVGKVYLRILGCLIAAARQYC